MKLRMLIVPCVVVLLAGCITYDRTGVLLTPIGVAGIHSFGPPKSAPSPDDMERIARATDRLAPKDEAESRL
jgi:hypothetical protein